MTGLEPAASRPPAVRATNCATSRRHHIKILQADGAKVSYFPRLCAGGCSQHSSTEGYNMKLPIVPIVQKICSPALLCYRILLL
jgi:hypothetical protein